MLCQHKAYLGILQKKDRRAVAYQIPVTFFGVKFHGKAPDIPLRVRGTAFSRHGGETNGA